MLDLCLQPHFFFLLERISFYHVFGNLVEIGLQFFQFENEELLYGG